MIVILCATEMEARPVIERLNAEKIPDDSFSIYCFTLPEDLATGHIIVTDVGRRNATRATEYAVGQYRPSQVINVGICGALTDNIALGEPLRVDAVGDGDPGSRIDMLNMAGSSSGNWKHLPGSTLLTVTKPVFDPARRTELAATGTIVDMEGYAIAVVCKEHNVPCELLKGISDRADKSGESDIKKNIATTSAKLADILAAGLQISPMRINQQKESGGRCIRKLLDFIKFEHTIFSVPLLFSGAWMGAGSKLPELRVLGFILLAGVGGRSLGMAVNRIFDRDVDALNERTATRELPSGKLSLLQAYMVAAAGLALYVAACAGLGRICLYLAPIPLVPLIAYSLLKRFTILCHFGIGLCMSLAPLGAFVAASGGMTVSRGILMLSLFTFCWISGYDIIYALQDIDSDRRTGIRSIPALLGETKAQVVAGLVHSVACAALAWLWLIGGAELLPLVAVGVAIAAMCFSYLQYIPLHARFFPASAIAGIAGALVPLFGELQ